MKRAADAVQALETLQSGQRVFVQGAAATPIRLLDGMVEHHRRLKNVEVIHMHTVGDARYAQADFAESFRIANVFVGPNMRGRLDNDRNDYLPCFLSEVPALVRSGVRPIDMALIHVSPPDKHGHCSLGTSVDVTRAAVDVAKTVIAQVNPNMPRVHGDGFVHTSRIDHYIEVDDPLPEVAPPKRGPVEDAIGEAVASLIDNGATLQMGIGAVPDAVMAALAAHKHLGIHSEMWTDGALKLIQSGVVDNSHKAIHPGKTVSSFLYGTKAVYDFIDDNPSVVQLDIGYVNQPNVIARNPGVAAINSAVEIDLTGQVCADSIGPRIISGVGGQMDFLRAAALSKGGKPILALPSRTKKDEPRIVAELHHGAGVVTTRAHVHWVVTEYGVVNLFGKTLGERAKALTSIAHPDDREGLERAWHARL